MPYIPEDQRNSLDPKIDALIDALVEQREATGGDYEGILNYTFTRLALGVIPEQRYKHINAIIGVFGSAGAEFYRRYGAPYEDEAIAKNGDVY